MIPKTLVSLFHFPRNKPEGYCFNQPTLPLGDDVLKFWDTHGPIYPYLKKIVEPYLSMVATSVPSERIFSKAGQVMTDIRNRLTGDNLNKLLFLGSLPKNDWHLE